MVCGKSPVVFGKVCGKSPVVFGKTLVVCGKSPIDASLKGTDMIFRQVLNRLAREVLYQHTHTHT